MAEIELVIKIDEKYLEYIHKAVEVDCTAPPYFVVRNLWESVLNGVPLPKGHGRLIDADKLELDDGYSNYDGYYHKYSQSQIYNAPTVLEAEVNADGDSD